MSPSLWNFLGWVVGWLWGGRHVGSWRCHAEYFNKALYHPIPDGLTTMATTWHRLQSTPPWLDPLLLHLASRRTLRPALLPQQMSAVSHRARLKLRQISFPITVGSFPSSSWPSPSVPATARVWPARPGTLLAADADSRGVASRPTD